MDIHNIENKRVNGKNIKLVFFNKDFSKDFNPKLVKLVDDAPIINKDNIVDRWLIQDKLGNDYKVKKGSLIKDESLATINMEKISKIMLKSQLRLFCKNNDLPEDSILDLIFYEHHLKDLLIYKKEVNVPINIWNISDLFKYTYSSIIIIDNQIVGSVLCEILSEYDDEDILYKNMNLYISNVDIREDYQGMKLCKPLLSYMISNLRRLGYEQLFIFNASRTKKGIPACICYYRAGIQNNYRMRTKKAGKVNVMKEEDCYHSTKSDTYYYMSNNISKRAVSKIKKKFTIGYN